MSRNLIVCCDGTWNTPDQKINNLPAPTNVVKIRAAIAESTLDGKKQLVYYHPGVGTEGGVKDLLAGGAFGIGISQNIQSAYYWLGQNYKSGDRIYLFGFSRGAYTVRSLAGMIGRCGLLKLTDNISDSQKWYRVHEAYENGYKNQDESVAGWKVDNSELIIKAEENDAIHFIGVWDTVGTLGIPNHKNFLNLFDRPSNWTFHDTKLGAGVTYACHAVAMDEKRSSFPPTLWSNTSHLGLKQRWFAGVHSDVGGGYLETGLSDCALEWMVNEAQSKGLEFNPEMTKQIKPDFQGIMHDSFGGIYEKLERPRPRPAPVIKAENKNLHVSVLKRHNAPPLSQAPYRKTVILSQKGDSETVEVFAKEQWNDVGIYLEKGTYNFSAKGEWLDKSIPCGPSGMKDGKFYLGEMVHIIGNLLGFAEKLWRRRNDQADFTATRRHEEFPWFALVGTVASKWKKNPLPDGTVVPYQAFMMAKNKGSVSVVVSQPGYLYAYPNDAWAFYKNNRGSVKLTVTKKS